VNDAQLVISSLVETRFDDAFVFGQGLIDTESSQAIGDTFIVITPVANRSLAHRPHDCLP